MKNKNKVNYFELTFYKLIEKRMTSLIQGMRKGNAEKGSIGTDNILLQYATHAQNSQQERVNIAEVKKVPKNHITTINGGFNIFNSNEDYHLFKKSSKKELDKESLSSWKKIIEKENNASPLSEDEQKTLNMLKAKNLTKPTPLNKDDFAQKLHDTLSNKTEPSVLLAKAFKEYTSNNPTKSFLKKLNLPQLIEIAEELKLNIFAPYVEAGYASEATIQYRMNRNLNLESMALEHFGQLSGKKEDIEALLMVIDDTQTDIAKIEKDEYSIFQAKELLKLQINDENRSEIDKNVAKEELGALNSSSYSILMEMFQEKSRMKSSLKECLSEVNQNIDNVDIKSFDDEQGIYGLYNKIQVNKIVCDSKDETLMKDTLLSVHEINTIIKENISTFDNLDVEIEEKVTIIDYGSKRSLPNLVLYAKSLKEIQDASIKTNEKVANNESNYKEGMAI